jgi:6-phosphogluconate dehydrogenase
MTSFAIIGLGKMGGNMARRLVQGGLRPVLFDQDAALTAALASELGCVAATSPAAAVAKLTGPRVVWLMLPSGQVTEDMVTEVSPQLQAGDVLVDGANSFYKDAIRRAASLKTRGVEFADAGVSGGVHGLANGYCLMVGGSDAALQQLRPYLAVLAPKPDTGWLHAGPAGAGHYVKMVHNGIEYGMMQAFAEGFAMLAAKKEFDIDLAGVGELWRHGSVVRSWLLDLTAQALKEDATLQGIKPHVADSGEGRWTAQEAVDLGIPTPVMSLALMMRFASQGQDEFGAKLLAKMRQGFGGHAVQTQA